MTLEEEQFQDRQYVLVTILSVILVAIFCLCGALWHFWRRLLAMKTLLEEHTNRALLPSIERLIDLECHHEGVTVELDVLRRQSADSRGDLEILFRAVRHASPHPEEPARQRLRFQDPRPVAEEPDGERDAGVTSPQPEPETPRGRPFRSDASRSRDGEQEGPDSEEFEEEYDHTDDPSLDDFIHGRNEYERRAQQAHNRARREHLIHHLTIQGNNLYRWRFIPMCSSTSTKGAILQQPSTSSIASMLPTIHWWDKKEMKQY